MKKSKWNKWRKTDEILWRRRNSKWDATRVLLTWVLLRNDSTSSNLFAFRCFRTWSIFINMIQDIAITPAALFLLRYSRYSRLWWCIWYVAWILAAAKCLPFAPLYRLPFHAKPKQKYSKTHLMSSLPMAQHWYLQSLSTVTVNSSYQHSIPLHIL